MVKEIELTKGAIALVNEEDYDRVSAWSWYLHSGGYACNKGGITSGATYMHRMILDCPEGFEVDHINGNRLDNRRENLRIVTRSQNRMNQHARRGIYSKYKGVSFDKRRDKWRAYIGIDGKYIHLGMFTCEIEAAKAYNEKALEIFGEYARLNVV